MSLLVLLSFILYNLVKGDILKKFKPNKYICYLYCLVPLIINAMISYSSNEDIWYVMKYGEIILKKGFIHMDVLSIHSGLHIVIQQGFSNIIFYLIYKYLGNFGFFLLCELFVCLYLFIIYKICMLLSKNKVLLSVLIASITCTLLEVSFITPRPQIFTFFNLLLVIYIMEVFYKNPKTRFIYLLLVISFIQINLHASLWYYLFLFILPYITDLVVQKNKSVFKILGIVVVMFLVGFINPYTYENVFFPFLSYDSYINQYILELFPVNIASTERSILMISLFFYFILFMEIIIYIYYKKGKLELRHFLLIVGTTILALANVRNIPIFIIASLPLLSNYLKKMKCDVNNDYVDTKKTWVLMVILILVIASLNPNRLESRVKNGGDFLKDHYDKDLIIYTSLDYGSYVEYLGFHSFFDTRAEVFLKKANKKEDIFKEAMRIETTCINYKDFINKYKFTHMIVCKNACLYYYLKKENIKIIYKDKEYVIFEL